MLDGSAGMCCNCDETPVVCGGTTQCRVTFAAGEDTKCVWVKVDGDDIPTDDRKVGFDVEGGDDNATLIIKDEQDGQPLGITHNTVDIICNTHRATLQYILQYITYQHVSNGKIGYILHDSVKVNHKGVLD